MKVVRLLAVLLLFAGASLTGRAGYLHAKARLASVLIRRSWEQSLVSGGSRPPWPRADTRPIARLIIPRLKYDEIVLDGATPRTLAFGPALMRNGSGLGGPGNVLIAGHRTSWFLPLESIAQGDAIKIQWFDERRVKLVERTYKVEFIEVVDPSNVSLLEPTSQDALTLVTCYPFGHARTSPQRLMVRASPLGRSRPVQNGFATSGPSFASVAR